MKEVWCVFANYLHSQDLLYIFKLKKDALMAAKVEQENYRVSGGNVPTIVIEKWEVE